MKSKSRQVIIAGNWKMHKTGREAVKLTEQIQAAVAAMLGQENLPQIILMPPFTSLSAVGQTLCKYSASAAKQSAAPRTGTAASVAKRAEERGNVRASERSEGSAAPRTGTAASVAKRAEEACAEERGNVRASERSEGSAAPIIKLGAQNMDWRNEGAFTGEISPLMLVDLNVQYVLVGHSERRQYFGETNATTPLRIKAALAHGIKPILCVGEMIDEREAELTDAVVGRQVGAALADIRTDQYSQIIIAYEPVWAIGTGNHCDATEANRVAAVIRKTVITLFARAEEENGEKGQSFDAMSLPILYGGSVKANNIAEHLKQENIDGALVGGASLKSEEFAAMIKAGQERVKRKPAAAAR